MLFLFVFLPKVHLFHLKLEVAVDLHLAWVVVTSDQLKSEMIALEEEVAVVEEVAVPFEQDLVVAAVEAEGEQTTEDHL